MIVTACAEKKNSDERSFKNVHLAALSAYLARSYSGAFQWLLKIDALDHFPQTETPQLQLNNLQLDE